MPSQRSQLEARFLGQLTSPASEGAAPKPELGELAGRRRDPTLFALALDRIHPDERQVRTLNKTAADPEVQELAESVRADGILQPLDVRYVPEEDRYRIVAGERRYAAAKLAGFAEVPVKLLNASETEIRRLQLIENIHRADLTPLELATALQAMVDDGASTDDLCRLLSKSKPYVHKALAIARGLSPDARTVIQAASEQFTSIAHLYEVAQLPAAEQPALLQRIAADGLTREQLLAEVAEVKQRRGSPAPRRGRPAGARPFSRVIPVEGGTVIVRLRKTRATRNDVLAALRQASEDLASEAA